GRCRYAAGPPRLPLGPAALQAQRFQALGQGGLAFLDCVDDQFSILFSAGEAGPGPGLYHVLFNDRPAFQDAAPAQPGKIQRTVSAIPDQFGQRPADGRRLLPAMAAEANVEIYVAHVAHTATE